MAELKIAAPNFNLSSSWRCAKSTDTLWIICYGPTTGSYEYTFSYALPQGARVNSAKVHATWGSPLSGIGLNQVNGISFDDDGFADVTEAATSTVTKVTFSFKVNGSIYKDSNLHTGSMGYSDVYLVLDYTVPMSEWSVSETEVLFGQSLQVEIVPADNGYLHMLTVAFGDETI